MANLEADKTVKLSNQENLTPAFDIRDREPGTQ